MPANPTTKLKQRLGAAIDWRVRDSVNAALAQSHVMLDQARQAERADDKRLMQEALAGLGEALTQMSSQITEHQRALGDLLEQLDRRVRALEKH